MAASSYGYDAMNRITTIVHRSAANNVLAQESLTYDTTGRITGITDFGGTTVYAYDGLDQLIGADHSAPGLSDEAYQYDANGNRQSSASPGQGYVTGADNRLLSDGSFTYSYDGKGSLIRRTAIATGVIREFTWDDRGRLVEIDDRALLGGPATQTIRFGYDAFNRRISKSVDPDGAGAAAPHTDYFSYDGANVILEFRDADGAAGPAAPAMIARNLFGPGADHLLAREDAAGAVRWTLSDHQGSVRDVVDNGGTVVNHITYDSFGKVVAQTDQSQSSRYLFAGREYDQESGDYYNRSRYYDPNIGRFLSQDPIGFLGRDLNLYRYVGNNPVQFRDPNGLAPNINLLSSSQAPAASALPSSSVVPVIDMTVGEFTVVGHGNQAGDGIVIYETDKSGNIVKDSDGSIKIKETLDADKVAELISKDPKYRKGQKVRLFVCNSGKKLAGDVAKKLDAKVTGPNGEIKIVQGVDRAIPDPGVTWITK